MKKLSDYRYSFETEIWMGPEKDVFGITDLVREKIEEVVAPLKRKLDYHNIGYRHTDMDAETRDLVRVLTRHIKSQS